MLRTFVAAGVALLVLVGATLAEKETGTQVKGKVKKVDADKGVLTLTVGTGDEAKDKDYKISDEAKVMGPDRKELKDGFKGLKAGTVVTVFTKGDKVMAVMVGALDKFEVGKPIGIGTAGKIKKVDAEKGVLTITVGKGDQAKDVDYKISDDTKIMVGPSQTTLASAIKNKQLKEGAAVMIFVGPDGKVLGVVIPGKEPVGGPLKTAPAIGKIKKVDADKGILTVTVGTGDQAKDVDYKITDDTRIMSAKTTPIKGGLKSEEIKVGGPVTIFVDGDGNVKAVLLAHQGPGATTVGKLHETRGRIKKVDADKGTLTVTVGTGGQTKDVEFKLNPATMIGAGSKGELPGGLKNKLVKTGADVVVYADEDGKVLGVQLIGLKGGESPGSVLEVKGTIKKVDAEKRVLTVSVGSGDEAKDKEFKISETAAIYGADRKQLTGGLKNEQFKAGTEVTLFADESGNVRGLMLGKKGTPKEKEKEKEKDDKENK
jgi:transcription antitermination factor NusG